MCGRFSLATDIYTLQDQFNFEFNHEVTINPKFNVAPSQQILTIGSNGGKRIGIAMKWELAPFWSKDSKIGYKMIHVRAEGIDQKPSFKTPFKRKRCLVICDGFYEWKKEGKNKQLFRFAMEDDRPFAFAGLWDEWDKNGDPLYLCTIITTIPNEITQEVHNRMPVILEENAYDVWMDSKMNDIEYLKSLLIPFPAQKMKSYPVSTIVNSPKNDVAECLFPINSL
ncbi:MULTISPECIES: SOS response-associated peptidase [Priestia]|uniref:SOS response-associated peptidase n=1 Tax=Priestia TaxID=2800373 RepID=UPI00232F2AD6|nr:SOS response-associated peptidase [Priestia sp. AB]MDC0706590.1 SOS response-associated peptidase [Priestia sp. AB]MED4213100.1 SOS response-associated peptidase [Priestia megaterium]